MSQSPAQSLINALTPAAPGEFRYIVMSSDVVWSEQGGSRRRIMAHVYLRVIQALIKKGVVVKQMKAFPVEDGLNPEVLAVYTLKGVKPEPETRVADVETAEAMAWRDERGRELTRQAKLLPVEQATKQPARRTKMEAALMTEGEADEFAASLKQTSAAYTLVLKDIREHRSLTLKDRQVLAYLMEQQNDLETHIHNL